MWICGLIFLSQQIHTFLKTEINEFFKDVNDEQNVDTIVDTFSKNLELIINEINYDTFKQKIKDQIHEIHQTVFRYFVKREKAKQSHFKNYHNVASLYGGAIIVETNKNSQNVKSLLSDDSDKYMLNQCTQENKFFTIMLREDVTVEGFSIVNKEFYSSNVKDIEIYGSQTYPTDEWISLGKVKVKDINVVQEFDLKRVWVRYIKFNLKSHYGNEYYCPITQVKVFGRTMLQDLRGELNDNFDYQKHRDLQIQLQQVEKIKLTNNDQLVKESFIFDTHDEEQQKQHDMHNEQQSCLFSRKSRDYHKLYFSQEQHQQDISSIDENNEIQSEKVIEQRQCLFMEMERYFLQKTKRQCIPIEQTINEIKQQKKLEEKKQQSILKTLTQHIREIEDYQKVMEQNILAQQQKFETLYEATESSKTVYQIRKECTEYIFNLFKAFYVGNRQQIFFRNV